MRVQSRGKITLLIKFNAFTIIIYYSIPRKIGQFVGVTFQMLVKLEYVVVFTDI